MSKHGRTLFFKGKNLNFKLNTCKIISIILEKKPFHGEFPQNSKTTPRNKNRSPDIAMKLPQCVKI